MTRISIAVVLTILFGVSIAEARHKPSHPAAVDQSKVEDQSKVDAKAPDPMTDPMAIPKWFGSAVDNILAGTGRALNPEPDAKK